VLSSSVQFLMEAPLSPLSSRPERSVAEGSAVRLYLLSNLSKNTLCTRSCTHPQLAAILGMTVGCLTSL
jgi:hypothetical protein